MDCSTSVFGLAWPRFDELVDGAHQYTPPLGRAGGVLVAIHDRSRTTIDPPIMNGMNRLRLAVLDVSGCASSVRLLES